MFSKISATRCAREFEGTPPRKTSQNHQINPTEARSRWWMVPSTGTSCDSKIEGTPVWLYRLCSCPLRATLGPVWQTSKFAKSTRFLKACLACFAIIFRSVISSQSCAHSRVSGFVAFPVQTDSWNKSSSVLSNVLLYLLNCGCGHQLRLLCEIITALPKVVLSSLRLFSFFFPGLVLFSPRLVF